MDTPPSPSHSGSSRSRRRSTHSHPSAVRRFVKDWWVEILIAVFVALALFLLVEQMQIRQALWAWLLGAGRGLEGLLSHLAQATINRMRQLTLSDLVAYVLLLAAAWLVLWRAKRRAINSPRLTATACPRCGGEMHRIHRRWYDRVFSLYIPVRRYQCTEAGCHWRGLRVKRSRRE
jgi:hypothetical protein